MPERIAIRLIMQGLKMFWSDLFIQFRQVKAVVHTVMVGHTLSTIAISDNGEGPCLLTVHSDGQMKFHRWYPPSSLHIEK